MGETPKIKVYIYNGKVESVYGNSDLVDVEIVSYDDPAADSLVDMEYTLDHLHGMHKIHHNEKHIVAPDEEEEDAF